MAMDWDLTNNEPACRFRRFGCPKCGAKHRYGHRRSMQTCHTCGHWFSPTHNSRKYEEDRLTNLPVKEREAALKDINSVPPWLEEEKRKRKEKYEKIQAKKLEKLRIEQERLASRGLLEKFTDFIKVLFKKK